MPSLPTELTFDGAPGDCWARLRQYTSARIAIGRSGGSLPTRETLDFALAHARARDAVLEVFQPQSLAAELRVIAGNVMVLQSAAPDRSTYIRRPDLGRRLSADSAEHLSELAGKSGGSDLVIIVADGLSSLAAHRQAPNLLALFVPRLRELGFTLAPTCVVLNGRVGVQDEIGSLLNASIALTLLGERPGLGVPDSLGAYFVYGPGKSRTDADRNCVSNIRPDGLKPGDAAERLVGLLIESRDRRLSGTALKERATQIAARSFGS